MPPPVSLSFERSISIRHRSEGLNEPSGLSMSTDRTLWTVSDESRKIFNLNQEGKIVGTFDIHNVGLEGIATDPNRNLWAVDEDSGKILCYDSVSGQQVRERKLRDIGGYCAVKEFFNNDNNGLEGIAWDPLRSELLLLKEAKPGLLIAVDDQLERIVAIDHLNENRGFFDDTFDERELDFSGICFDAPNDLFWILSDKAGRVWAFDRRRGHVRFSFPLVLERENRRIKKPEGIALDCDAAHLYVVSDKDATLTVFRVCHSETSQYPARENR